jgi:hypothetical protein
MRGAPYPREITDNYESPPKTRGSVEYISNMSATKSQFFQNNAMKDFEYKKENYMSILKAEREQGKKVHRATTKGKFNEDIA